MKTKTTKLPVDQFILQFPIVAQQEIDYFFNENKSIPKTVGTVLDFLLDSLDGYPEEEEIKNLIKEYEGNDN
jgi:hypothetical protein